MTNGVGETSAAANQGTTIPIDVVPDNSPNQQQVNQEIDHEEGYGHVNRIRLENQIERDAEAHSEQVGRLLSSLWKKHYGLLVNAAHEEAGSKLKDKDDQVKMAMLRISDLERIVSQLSYDEKLLQTEVSDLEKMSASMRSALQAATFNGAQEEDAVSSYVDPNSVVDPLKLKQCLACDKAEATFVVFPCRHMGLCKQCAESASVTNCPVCNVPKIDIVEVIVP